MSGVPLMFVEPGAASATANFCLFGPGGTGKSFAATGWDGPVTVLNSEGAGGLAKSRAAGREIREVRFTGQAVLRPFCEYVKSGADGSQAVVVDTVNKVYKTLITELGGSKPQIQHYGQVNKILMDLIEFLRDQPINVVFVCHEQIADQEGDRIVRPLTGGQQLPEFLVSEVDVCAYTAKVAGEDGAPNRYLGQLAPDKGRRTKDRSDALGNFRDLNLPEWLSVYAAAMRPDNSDLPPGLADDEPDPAADPDVEAMLDLDDARAEAA